jgi:hypothetical protein
MTQHMRPPCVVSLSFIRWAVGAEVVYCVMCIFLVYTNTKNEERSRTRKQDSLGSVRASPLVGASSVASPRAAQLTSIPGLSGEVDKMFLSVAAVSSELVSTSGGSSHSPTPSMVGGQVSSYEKEKVAHFMSLALRYCMAHNSRRRDVDVDAVEQVRPESQAGQRGGGGAKPQHLHMLSAWCLVWLQDILRVLRAGGVTTAHQRGSISVASEAPPINTSIVSHTPQATSGGTSQSSPGVGDGT